MDMTRATGNAQVCLNLLKFSVGTTGKTQINDATKVARVEFLKDKMDDPDDEILIKKTMGDTPFWKFVKELDEIRKSEGSRDDLTYNDLTSDDDQYED